jgi:pimeloyl-ACP methyl ester carboxylesterase
MLGAAKVQSTRLLIAALILAASLHAGGAAADTALARRDGATAETYPAHDVIYDSVRAPSGERVRLIVTRPRDARNLPVIFVTGWLSCDSVEAPNDAKDSISLIFRRLAGLTNFALVRTDKPGTGDSEGDCAKTDFDTELAAYRAAFKHMQSYNFIDRSRIFVFGLSNGAGWAPLVPDGAPVKGYVIGGAWVKTWFEHMMEIERRRLTLSGKSPGEVNELMALEARLHTAYLVMGKAPHEIFANAPDLEKVWAGEGDSLYGRPHTYYQQLQKLNLAGAWAKVRVPVLALHGEFDWIMSRDDPEMIVALVNRNTPGAAKLVILPEADHGFGHVTSFENAFNGKRAAFDPKIADLIADWFIANR